MNGRSPSKTYTPKCGTGQVTIGSAKANLRISDLHRKNALCYKTQNGAQVGGIQQSSKCKMQNAK